MQKALQQATRLSRWSAGQPRSISDRFAACSIVSSGGVVLRALGSQGGAHGRRPLGRRLELMTALLGFVDLPRAYPFPLATAIEDERNRLTPWWKRATVQSN